MHRGSMSHDRNRTTTRLPAPQRLVRTDEVVLTPDILGAQLDAWAFRREKVLFIVDHEKARQARELARRCRFLVGERFEPGTSATGKLAEEWRVVRRTAAQLFASTSDVRAVASDPRRRCA